MTLDRAIRVRNPVPDPRTLLAVHAHPDDETITMGGTLARYSAEGIRTVVVTCTRGDLGTILDPALAHHDAGRLRERELEAAARTLGVSRVVQLGYSDSGMAGTPDNCREGAFWATDTRKAADRLLQTIEEERPQVVVTYDETGGYGHPDHLKAHQIAVAAFEQIHGPRLFFIRFPLTWTREFVRSLRDAGIDAPGSAPSGADGGPSIVEIGVPDELVTTAVDVRRYLQKKLAALACHGSQIPADHFLRRMPTELAARLWAFEYFSLEGGQAEGADRADLFAGLAWY